MEVLNNRLEHRKNFDKLSKSFEENKLEQKNEF